MSQSSPETGSGPEPTGTEMDGKGRRFHQGGLKAGAREVIGTAERIPTAKLCKPCGGLDANEDTIAAVPGSCGICGRYGAVYTCPARPLPGLAGAVR